MITRRRILSRGALAAGGVALLERFASVFTAAARAQSHDHSQHPAEAPTDRAARPAPPRAARRSGLPHQPVVTPDGATLPFVMKGGVKEFHLTAEPVRQEFAPGMTVNGWGYNGRTPGPTIEAVEGDRIRILVTNRLPEHTSIHWHGILLPNGMDGVGGLLQPHIKPGDTFAYEFTLRQHGTYMYHPHADETVQMAMGMMGFLVIHPRGTETARRPRLLPLPARVEDRARHGDAEPQHHGRLQHLHLQRPRRSRAPLRSSSGSATASACASRTSAWTATRSTSTAIACISSRRTAARSRSRPGGRRPPSTSLPGPRARSSSWPTTRATGRSIATRAITP